VLHQLQVLSVKSSSATVACLVRSISPFSLFKLSVFPTIQTDMKRPQKFSTVVIVSLTAILLMMLPVSITGYAVYGSDVENNILDQLDNHSLMTQTANVLITLHLLFAFAIVQNPLHQGAEAALGLDPLNQKKKCIAVRLTIMVIGICLLQIFFIETLK
jgi:vesicular inhibitory amino acid transporter